MTAPSAISPGRALPRTAIDPAFLEKAAIAVFAAFLLSTGLTFLAEGDIVRGETGVLGGDFLAFYAASKGMLSGDGAALYDPSVFEARLRGVVDLPRYGLFWLYPPPAAALIAPLALAPYPVSYALFMGAGLAAWFAALRRALGTRRIALVAALSPLGVIAIVQGQTSLIAAALLATAATASRERPVLAGVCAGLLVFKPQIAILAPIAFAAAGRWRAFGAAAATVGGAILASLAALGPEHWAGFFEAARTLRADVAAGGQATPYANQIPLYANALAWGAPAKAAMAAHLAAAAGLAALVAVVWRRRGGDDLSAAVLCAAAPLATPYAYAYELVVVAFAAAVVARRGASEGWLAGERPGLAAGWLAAALYGFWAQAEGWPVSTLIAASALALAVRRALRQD